MSFARHIGLAGLVFLLGTAVFSGSLAARSFWKYNNKLQQQSRASARPPINTSGPGIGGAMASQMFARLSFVSKLQMQQHQLSAWRFLSFCFGSLFLSACAFIALMRPVQQKASIAPVLRGW